MPENRWNRVIVEKEDQVATVRIRSMEAAARDESSNIHWQLARTFSDLRGDNDVRVIVLTGAEEGAFLVGPKRNFYEGEEGRRGRNDPYHNWETFTGVIWCHETMASIEKPIVARVNGDAMGLGASLMFAADIIVAQEDARIVDWHMGMGEVEGEGPLYGMVPGDGGLSLVPLYMTPAKAKEFLMLAKEYSAEELAHMGVINYAVPGNQLDALVGDIVQRLLKRSAYALAWTKRVANRHVMEQLNRTVDAGAAYEMVNFLQIEKLGWVDKTTLR